MKESNQLPFNMVSKILLSKPIAFKKSKKNKFKISDSAPRFLITTNHPYNPLNLSNMKEKTIDFLLNRIEESKTIIRLEQMTIDHAEAQLELLQPKEVKIKIPKDIVDYFEFDLAFGKPNICNKNTFLKKYPCEGLDKFTGDICLTVSGCTFIVTQA